VILSIWYHGTTRRGYKEILRGGLKTGSYLTPHLDSAIAMGGKYVFAVYLREDPSNYWEWVSEGDFTEFYFIMKYRARLLYYNPEEFLRIKAIHAEEEGCKPCRRCKGLGELTYKNDGHHLLPKGCSFRKRRKIIVCSECNGWGRESP